VLSLVPFLYDCPLLRRIEPSYSRCNDSRRIGVSVETGLKKEGMRLGILIGISFECAAQGDEKFVTILINRVDYVIHKVELECR